MAHRCNRAIPRAIPGTLVAREPPPAAAALAPTPGLGHDDVTGAPTVAGRESKRDVPMPSLDALAAAEPTVWLAWTSAPEEATRDLARRVSTGHVADRRIAIREIAHLVAHDRSAAPRLLDALELALRDADAQVRISAIDALASVVAAGVTVPYARRALFGLLRDEIAFVRSSAITLLARVARAGWDADERVAISAALTDRDEHVRVESSAMIRHAADAGDDLGHWLPALASALDDASRAVRANARDTLERIAKRDRDDATRILGMLLRENAARSDEAHELTASCRRILSTRPKLEEAAPWRVRRPRRASDPPPRGHPARWWQRLSARLVALWRDTLEPPTARFQRVEAQMPSEPIGGPSRSGTRPALERWGRGVSTAWSEATLRKRRAHLVRWCPSSFEDMELQRRWLNEIDAVMQARGCSRADRGKGVV